MAFWGAFCSVEFVWEFEWLEWEFVSGNGSDLSGRLSWGPLQSRCRGWHVKAGCQAHNVQNNTEQNELCEAGLELLCSN